MVSVVSFSLQEEYGSGWTGTAVLQVSDSEGNLLNIGQTLGVLLDEGIEAGVPTKLHLFSSDESGEFTLVRTWPCVITLVEPFFIETGTDGLSEKFCRVCLVDPITHLADQPVWGSYRSMSLGEIVGGVLSMAAGGNGKPSIEPLLPGMPRIRIVEEIRSGLKLLPITLAVGHTLGQWLGDVFGGLGVRAHLRGENDGTFQLILSDQPPAGSLMNMNPEHYNLDPETAANLNSATLKPDSIAILGYSSFSSTPTRGAVIDNPILGSPTQTGALGTNDAVFTGTEVDTNEAYNRVAGAMFGEFTEMFRVSALTVAPEVQPGQVINTSDGIAFGFTTWQVARAAHHLHRDKTYYNDATLLIGKSTDSWHPPHPHQRPLVYTTGIIDAGEDYAIGQQVPRDRLGRIYVTFPFRAGPAGEERKQLAVADSDDNLRLTLDDFESEQIDDYRENEERWQRETDAYWAGEYRDPYPGRDDSDLSDDELTEREQKRESRDGAIAYMAYLRADSHDQEDVDRDGYVSERDRLLEDEFPELVEILAEDESRTELESQSASLRAGTLAEDYPDVAADPVRRDLLAKYDSLFSEPQEKEEEDEEEEEEEEEDDAAPVEGEPAQEDPDPEGGEAQAEQTEEDTASVDPEYEANQARYAAVRRDAALAGERWPPRIPLLVSGLMAGHMHGFIPAHRQGDICRVVVYSPFSAEIVGFQYRSNRLISPNLTEALAGLVVEHNYGEAWSGLVFRRTEQLESKASSPAPPPEEDAAESGTDT